MSLQQKVQEKREKNSLIIIKHLFKNLSSMRNQAANLLPLDLKSSFKIPLAQKILLLLSKKMM